MAIGANHGAGPASALTALQAMGGSGLPLAALPNIGLASMSGGRVIYPHAAPEYFAEFAAYARELGAKVIGGCCGTTPTEIGAIRRALDEQLAPRAPLEVAERELAAAVERDDHETKLAADLREGRFVTSIQIDPPLGANYAGLLEIAAAIRDSGTGAYVDVNDNATARVGMNPLIVSAAIERLVGVETIPHLTPRDTTIMGLEAVLLGAHAEGVRNVLAVTGDPPEVGDYPGSGGVYEVDSIGLTHLISGLNRGVNFNGKAIDAPTSFFVGVAVNPNADDPDLELERFGRKIDEGARFAMTQIVYDLDHLDRFLDRLGGPSPIPVLVGIFPLTSYRLARRLHNEVPGIVVPEELQEQLRDAGTREAEIGFEHARELLAAARDRAAGVYVVAPYKKPFSVLDLLVGELPSAHGRPSLSAQAGPSTPAAGRVEHLPHDDGGDPVAARAADARGEDGHLDAAVAVDRGPAGVPVPDHPGQARDRPLHGPVPVGVVGEDLLGLADAARPRRRAARSAGSRRSPPGACPPARPARAAPR